MTRFLSWALGEDSTLRGWTSGGCGQLLKEREADGPEPRRTDSSGTLSLCEDTA